MDTSYPFLIYVIDDDIDDFGFLREVVAVKWPSIRLVHFAHPDKFIKQLDTLEVPALIILDVNMPSMDGFEVMQKLKEHPRWKSMPFLFLSTSAEDKFRHRAMDGGASIYLVKPATLEHWSEIVTELDKIRVKEHLILYGKSL